MVLVQSTTITNRNSRCPQVILLVALLLFVVALLTTTLTSSSVHAFVGVDVARRSRPQQQQPLRNGGFFVSSSKVTATTQTGTVTVTALAAATSAQDSSASSSAVSNDDNGEIVARRIVVVGRDVQGGYYRSCVLNEAGRFRRLVGTMTPPDDSQEAEIYVEGKRKLVEGFVRWCQKSNVGLNQIIQVKQVTEEDPTGLYDEFYIKTK